MKSNTLQPITPQKKSLIVNSFRRVFETGDINQLTKTAYNYIYLASGFIAHYNLYGFRDAYQNVDELKTDIISNQQANRWLNFHPGETNYEYYRSKADVYQAIVALIPRH